MVRLELDDQTWVLVETGDEKPCSYTVFADGTEVVAYETSADVRTSAGLIGLRNVVSRRVGGVEKEEVRARLASAIEHRADALDETLGPR